MNRGIRLTTYVLMLTVEAAEDFLEFVKRLIFERTNSETETRNPHLNDRFSILPPTAVR
jgi:hypothetical protein